MQTRSTPRFPTPKNRGRRRIRTLETLDLETLGAGVRGKRLPVYGSTIMMNKESSPQDQKSVTSTAADVAQNNVFERFARAGFVVSGVVHLPSWQENQGVSSLCGSASWPSLPWRCGDWPKLRWGARRRRPRTTRRRSSSTVQRLWAFRSSISVLLSLHSDSPAEAGSPAAVRVRESRRV